MSEPTPRTDAAELDNSEFSDWGTGPSGYVRRSDMETLERELSQLKTLNPYKLFMECGDARQKNADLERTLTAQRAALLALFDEAERTGSQGIAVRGREIIG